MENRGVVADTSGPLAGLTATQTSRDRGECDESRGQQREPRTPLWCGRLSRLHPRRLADFERIDPDRVGNVLQLGRAEIADREIESPLDLTISVLRQAYRARLANAFQTRCDIDAVAHQIAVGLLDDIAKMDAYAEVDAALSRKAGVALDHLQRHLRF